MTCHVINKWPRSATEPANIRDTTSLRWTRITFTTPIVTGMAMQTVLVYVPRPGNDALPFVT